MKEPRKVRWNVLAAIEYVCSKTKDKKLKFENTPKMQKCLEHLMEEILNGSKVTLNRLEELCNSEKAYKQQFRKKNGLLHVNKF